MSKKPDGGPAYPGIHGQLRCDRPHVTAQSHPGGVEFIYHNQGMSLRDKIAITAMLGYMTTPTQLCDNGVPIERNPKTVATAAYFMADAMLKARDE